MKVECEACSTLMEPEVRPAAAGVELICASCGHVALLGGEGPVAAKVQPEEQVLSPLAAPEELAKGSEAGPPLAPSPDPVAVLAKHRLEIDPGSGEVRCPKCGFRQDDEVACHRCGLAFSEGRRQLWEDVPEESRALAEELDRRWELLSGGDFFDDDAHRAFVGFARSSRLLERAARHYRFHAQDHAGDAVGERAAKALEQIVELMHAEFVMFGGSSEGDAFSRRVTLAKKGLMVAAVLMCIGVLALAVFFFGPFR